MSTLGQKPATQHVSTEKQTITGNGGTSYTLQQSVSQASDIEVFVNNTRQEPTVAYTASGTTLTMTGAVNSSDSFYVIFQGKAIQTAGLPVDAAITASTVSSSGNTTVGGTLDVTGNTTARGTLGITGNTTAGGTLGVTGNTTVGGTLGVTGATTLSSSITTATGHNFVPEFISNGYIAGNSASTINITDALDQSKYAIHRIVGAVAGSWSTGNTHVFMRFLRNNDTTQVTDAHYHYALNNDTSAGAGGFGEQNVTYWRITRQSATTLMVPFDMYIYHQHGINFMRGHSAYHDQSTNRGYSEFGGIYHGTHTLTGLFFASSAGNNTGSMNISIYGYRFRQNNASKYNGAVGI